MSLDKAERRDRKISKRRKNKSNVDYTKKLREKKATLDIKRKRKEKINKN